MSSGDVGVALDEDEAGGATVFTVMPNGASSGQLRVRPICAYKTEPTRPETMLARTHQPVASPGQTEGEL